MRADPFLFFRATFYRWAQLWPEACPKLARAPRVHTVGDLHVENFGTWRDAEGRLVWGVNDFDEAFPMSFPNDLVRVAVSALLAARSHPGFKLKPGEISAQLADGYHCQIERGGEPFVLMEHYPKLRKMAVQDLRQPAEFWRRSETKTVPLDGPLPGSVRKAFRKILPPGAKPNTASSPSLRASAASASTVILLSPNGRAASWFAKPNRSFPPPASGPVARPAPERAIHGSKPSFAPPSAAPILL